MLAISLLTIPQMTANLFTYKFKRIIWLSVIIGFLRLHGRSFHFLLSECAFRELHHFLFYSDFCAVCKVAKAFQPEYRERKQEVINRTKGSY